MKKRAKQLAMLGLAVTMVVGTQMTAFASNDEENTPVAVEVQAEETSEEVVAGTEVAEEVKAVEGTEVTEEAEKVADAEEATVLGVSDETEPTTEVEAEALPETEAEPAPEAQTTPDTQVTTPDAQVEADEQTPTDIKGELTSIRWGNAVDGVITLTDKDFDATGGAEIEYTLYGTPQDGGLGNGIYFDIYGDGDFGGNPQDQNNTGEYKGGTKVYKDELVREGGTKTYTGTFYMDDTEAGGIDDTLDFSITVKYEKGNEGGGTVTPEPEKPQPEPEKPQPDGGNGGTETPDPEKDGWIKTEEGWKYYENGQKVTGWKAVSEKWYYFNENGIMETGWASVGGHWYYLNADGSMATGWVSVGGHWYYLNTDGTMVIGWASVGGHWYYLNTDGSMETDWVSVGGHWYYLNTDGTMVTGWASVGGHWYYLNEDGTMASNQWIDGWYVDASGKML